MAKSDVFVPPRRAPNEVTEKLDALARDLGDGEDALFLLTLSALFDKFPNMTLAMLDQLAN